MDLKILMVILLYYTMFSMLFYFGGSSFPGYTLDANLTGDALTSNETGYTGGTFGTGITFSRFVGLITFGVGLPASTPSWFVWMFGLWQSCFLIFSVGWFISSIWNG
jgi:hypothetical protein